MTGSQVTALPSVELLPSIESETRAPRTFYKPELDALRFCAFFGVFMYHTFPSHADGWTQRHVPENWAQWLSAVALAGSFGVDLFFVLSSYLITELLVRERTTSGTVHVKAFYIRRILRIWPVYFVFVGVSVVAAALNTREMLSWQYVAAFLLLSGNWICAFGGFPGSIITPLWSVSIEEQFYLVWPLVIRRVGVKATFGIAVALLVLSSATRYVMLVLGAFHAALWCTTFTRLDPIACGIIVAILLKGRAPRLDIFSRVALVVAGIGIWILAGRYGGVKDSPLPLINNLVAYPAIAAASVAVLIGFLGADYTFLRHRLTTYLGKISYGLYAYHMLGLLIAASVLAELKKSIIGYIGYWWLGFILTLGISAASYRWLEAPFLRLKERFTFVNSRPV